ncbi:MAG: metallophosphoesterase [Planctomycetota bacterium]|jgi:hypothetical protein
MNRRPMLSALLIAVALLAGFSGAATARVNPGTESKVDLSVPAPDEGFTVAILADRTTGFESGLAVLERAVAEINLLKPDLVVHIGDLVPGYIRDMGQWEEDIRRVQAILGRLEVPFFPLPGNHDVITGTGSSDDRRGEELYARHFGPLYYSFDYRGAHFVCLYTEETLESRPSFSEAQLRWLRDDLARTTASQAFVFMHKPVWQYDGAAWEEVHQILRRHPVRAVFAGHFHHYYKSQRRDGIQYYVIGVTGGRLFSPELAGGLEHYCLLHVEPAGYRLALVKPGHILPDDYVVAADFHAMEELRMLSPEQTGVVAPVCSPELGPVEGQVAVRVANPLDEPLAVVLRGLARGGSWSFSPPALHCIVPPGGREFLYLTARSSQVPARQLVAPDVEIQYTYVDSRRRTVPIVLRRRVPLARQAGAALETGAIALDARADESAWERAPVLTTAVWEASPYETGEAGPSFRVFATVAGVYFFAESLDSQVVHFRDGRMLSDALFVGAVPLREDAAALDATEVPVAVIYPFGPGRQARAEQAIWHPKRPMGPEVSGVHVAAEREADGRGWRCEGFVPWDVLLGHPGPVQGQVRFNIGAWDNDGDLFTELHSWAPTTSAASWGLLELRGRR